MRYYTHLTFTNRLKIERMRLGGASARTIANALHVHISTIYRELKRGQYVHLNSDYTTETRYSPDIAQERYKENLRAKGMGLKIGNDYAFASCIESLIADRRFSPAAALGEIQRKGMKFCTSICVSTLYSYIRKGVFGRITSANLPRKGTTKKKHCHVRPSRAPAGKSIEERPEEANKRETFGHWEMDTVVGCRGSKSVLLVLTERASRYEIARKMPDKTAASCVGTIDQIEREMGAERFRKTFKTITVDNGCEFSDCKGIEDSCISGGKRTALYYCHPYSSYERGSNENQNGMLRRFFPKGTNFDKVDDAEIRRVVKWMNDYPRGIFGFRTAEEKKIRA